jgi:hypothetical protein
MEDELTLPREPDPIADCKSDQPGAKAVEALVWTIAQEFVDTIDEFCGRLLSEDEGDEPAKTQTAGS